MIFMMNEWKIDFCEALGVLGETVFSVGLRKCEISFQGIFDNLRVTFNDHFPKN